VRGRESIGHAGNAHLRTALYLATLSAARHNPHIRPFYDRLRAAGKPTKVARCAAAAGAPMAALRAITDGAHEPLPLDFELCFDSDGQFHHTRLIRLLARHPAAVRLLWEVCQIPDFRKVMSDSHARFLAHCFGHLAGPAGRLPPRGARGETQSVGGGKPGDVGLVHGHAFLG